jgi:GxxExxY protein
LKLRIESPLPPELEVLVQRTIGCCLSVHRQLGPGLLEAVYPKAIALELESLNIPFEREHPVPVLYRDRTLCHHRLDLFIDRQLILEVKSVEKLLPIHVAQVISYLRVTGVRIGLLVNFNVPILARGIRRVIL